MSDSSSFDQNIDTLARLAAERPPDDRADFLRDLCPDEQTRQAVWKRLYELFPEDEETGPDEPSEGPGGRESDCRDGERRGPKNRMPDRIGAWQIHSELGANPVYNTYLARRDDEQDPEQAALIFAYDSLDKRNQKEARERFYNQLDILEQFRHPNVVSVLDGGVTGLDPDHGRAFCPYFVMEYVEGVPLDTYCTEHGLGVDARLRLFRQLCEAVHFSHQNLIVCYDTKPSDALVVEPSGSTAAPPQVKLPEVGIETALKETWGKTDGLRRLDDLTLDIRYTSPELVEHDLVTTATDVYSLGVVLCELLTGSLPYGNFRKLSMSEFADTIASASVHPLGELVSDDGDPPVEEAFGTAPEALRDVLEGDLNAVAMKALRKEPGRRYSSAAALCRDVERCLSGQPVEAQSE